MKLFDKTIEDLRGMNLEPMDDGLSQEEVDAHLVGNFLFRNQGCDRELKGFFFGQAKERNTLSFSAFLHNFKFKNLPIDTCWRRIFSITGLPKEGQQICRLLEVFQDVYLLQNKDVSTIQQWPDDTVWTLSIILLDLNGNLYNPNVKSLLKFT